MSADRFEIHDHGSKLTVRDTKYGSEVSMLRVRSYSRELTVMAGAIRQQARDIEELRYQSKTLDMLAARALGDEALEESIMDEMDSLPDNGSKSGYVLAGVLAERDQLRTDLAATVGRSSSLERTIATLQMRLRRAGQLLIEEIGADGPEAADDTAERAAAPQFVAGEVTDEICERVFDRAYGLQSECGEDTSAHEESNAWLTAWQRELGPALGLAEIREPTPEECEEIERLWSRTLDSVSETQEVRPETCGRAMFYAVRAVLWPKEGL